MRKYFLLFVGLSFLFISCDKSDEQQDEQNNQEEQQEETTANKLEDYPIQDFMWSTMNLWYLYQANVPNLSDTKRSSEQDQDYIDFLASNPNPEEFYYEQLLTSTDRFSFHSENYTDLVQAFQGVSKSNGLEFGLGLIGDTDGVFGYVRYVSPGSNAATKNINRGDFFIGVNGTDLTRTNYVDLLFGNNDTYTLNMATVANGVISPNGNEVSLTKVEGFEANPILINQVIEVQGNTIGYLMFNQFTGNAPEQLNTVFTDFKSQGITDLILDLRYNPGGFGSTSTVLASLIYGTDTNQLLYKRRYNSKIEAEINEEQLLNYFTNTTGSAFDNQNTPLNSLNLSRLYVITTRSSASASELVINSLDAYIDVIQIGETTTGKNEGSLTFVDDPENGNVYDAERESFINPDNQWAIQPIVTKVENANGFGDYSNGLVPEIQFPEDITNMGVLGNPNEPMLARAIDAITGNTAKTNRVLSFPARTIDNSSVHKPMRDNLILDGEISFDLK